MTIFSRSTLLSALVALGTLSGNAMTTDVDAESAAVNPAHAVFTFLQEREALITNPATKDEEAKKIMRLLIKNRHNDACYTGETLKNLFWEHSPGRYKLQLQIIEYSFLQEKDFAFTTLRPYAEDLYAVCTPQQVQNLFLEMHYEIAQRNTSALQKEVEGTIAFYKRSKESLLAYEQGRAYPRPIIPTAK